MWLTVVLSSSGVSVKRKVYDCKQLNDFRNITNNSVVVLNNTIEITLSTIDNLPYSMANQ